MPDERLTEEVDEGTKNWNRWTHQGATIREKEKLESGLVGDVKIYPIKYIEVEENKY